MAASGASRMAADHERDLVARVRHEPAAFAELYDFYLPRIYGFIFRRVHDQPVAEDLTSMTFQRALESLRRADFRNESFGGWLYRVASNAVVDQVRANRRVVSLGQLEEREEPVDVALDSFAAALDRDQLRRALVSLPAGHRELLVMRFYDDLNAKELATAFGCTRETIAVRLHRALRALRAAVTQEAVDVA